MVPKLSHFKEHQVEMNKSSSHELQKDGPSKDENDEDQANSGAPVVLK